jgi:cold shock CspA family protein/ribosome-associated translation inhibitor RaiA
MTLTPQITFRNMDADPRTELLIQREIAKLERYFPRLMSCRVTFEAPVRKAVHYKVRIDLGMPGKELVVKRTPSLHETLAAQETAKKTKSAEIQRVRRMLAAAVRDAFADMRRRLQDHTRGAVKAHVAAPAARVARLFPEEGYGFLEAADGREIYFHANAVLDGHFDGLRIGAEVEFVEAAGDLGPQASTVRLIHPEKQLRAAAHQVVLAPARARRGA